MERVTCKCGCGEPANRRYRRGHNRVRRIQESCKRGHPLADALVTRSGRRCRACHNEASKRRYHEKKAGVMRPSGRPRVEQVEDGRDPYVPWGPLLEALADVEPIRFAERMSFSRFGGKVESWERKLFRARSGQYKMVRFSTAEQICLVYGFYLEALYPLSDAS